VWYLQKNSRAIAGIRFTTAGATMFQIREHLDRLLHNSAGLATLDIDDKAQAARIMFVSGVVKTLL
jgi:predicted mannosyl-3-phosphoglycerate phosphatase (HAD superfamily)